MPRMSLRSGKRLAVIAEPTEEQIEKRKQQYLKVFIKKAAQWFDTACERLADQLRWYINPTIETLIAILRGCAELIA